MQDSTDFFYMSRALLLAEQGRYTVSPNPMVGCVIARNGQIVGEGWHERAGEAHAEIKALQSAGTNAAGAALYVTLEPCCHHGRTPPCTNAIIQSGVSKVIIACLDPNPLMSGKGIQILKDAGIEVLTGVLSDKASKLNDIFFHYMKTQRPFVIAKWAISLDGKTTTHPEDDKRISGSKSHHHVHRTRELVDAVLIGKKTAVDDNPLLTVRYTSTHPVKQPVRIIVSTHGDIPLDSHLFHTRAVAKTLVVTTSLCPDDVISKLDELGVGVIVTDLNRDGMVDLKQALIELGKRNITSLLVEGGQQIQTSFFQDGLVNKVEAYIAPVIIASLTNKLQLGEIKMSKLGEDYYITGIT